MAENNNNMMKLQKVYESRDVSKRAELPIPEKELCDRYEQVTTAMVNDVLREMNILYQTLPVNILPLREEMKVAGIAFTLKGSKNLDITDEMEQRAQMLEAIEPDSICVWDTCGDDESAQWGEIMTMASIKRGCRGAIVDGGVRDTACDLRKRVACAGGDDQGIKGRFRAERLGIRDRVDHRFSRDALGLGGKVRRFAKARVHRVDVLAHDGQNLPSGAHKRGKLLHRFFQRAKGAAKCISYHSVFLSFSGSRKRRTARASARPPLS